MDALSQKCHWKDEWKCWRVRYVLGSSHFDEECGNELRGKNEIGRELLGRPLGVGDIEKGELWAFYSVVESDVNEEEEMEEMEEMGEEPDMLFVNVIEDEHYKEIILPTSEPPTCKDVLKAVDSLPAYHGKEKVCFCMEHGKIAMEEEASSIVRYGLKYQAVSQLCVQCITHHPPKGIKCFSYVIERWERDSRPSFSHHHIPRVFYVQEEDTYQQIKEYLVRVFGAEGRRVNLLYLPCYLKTSSCRKDWVTIETLNQTLGRNPVDGLLEDDLIESEGDYLHCPIFCLYCPGGLHSGSSSSSLSSSLLSSF